MTVDDFRTLALRLPEAAERAHMRHPALRAAWRNTAPPRLAQQFDAETSD